MSLDNIRLSQTAKDQLIKLKRVTGIKNWNVLCRWALSLSLHDPSTPLVREIITDSNIEMSWKTFAGQYGEIYLALLKQRCAADNEPITDERLSQVLSMHLHRGIGFLAGRRDLQSISDLVLTAT